jgi:hypothetical protein
MTNEADQSRPSSGSWLMVILAWVLVGLPLAWGVSKTFQTAVKLFR